MSARDIRYVFPFTTYMKAGGTFNPTYSLAAQFVTEFKRGNPDARVLAWIGLPLRSRDKLGVQGYVNLGDALTRARIAALAAELVGSAGFDGIHLDAETVRSDDADFLRLLDEVRAAVGPNVLLSVAGAHWTPASVSALPIIGNLRWSTSYYREVADRVDQIAVMSYASYLPAPALYRLWLREQTKAISRALAGTRTELLMGLSVSRERTRSHDPASENMGTGLAGICAGVRAAFGLGETAAGIGVYASWEADDQDWAEWQRWQSPRLAR